MSPHFRFIDLGSDFKPRRNKFTIRQAVIVKTNNYFITRGVFHVDAEMQIWLFVPRQIAIPLLISFLIIKTHRLYIRTTVNLRKVNGTLRLF